MKLSPREGNRRERMSEGKEGEGRDERKGKAGEGRREVKKKNEGK